ncbi:hypothetical protein ACFQUU_23070 [Herbaspirillum sp. GCM10030257]|uniref:hypothetical protein n=1 Tax=Herbaspirillum sp. GCM10030257 TaxID=3273393 RepID=UPI0036097C9A
MADQLHTRRRQGYYEADFSEQGAYSCRILVPGMSEIYPVEYLEWDNNKVGNGIRPALLRLSELSGEEAAKLLAAHDKLFAADR